MGRGVRVDVNIEVNFCENSKKIFGGGSGRRDQVGRGQGGCERRSEVFVNIIFLGGGGRVWGWGSG